MLRLLTILLTIVIFLSGSISKESFEYKKRGNREEGIRAVGIGAPNLELLSFVAHKEKTKWDADIILRIRFFLPKVSSFYITAKELRVRKFYIMKPLQHKWPSGWHEFSPWPTKDVLKPLGISLDDLGIVGKLNRDRIGSGEIAPLIIYHSSMPSQVNKYTLHFLPRDNLKRMEYRLYKVYPETLVAQQRIMMLSGGSPFSITLDLSNQNEGYYKLIMDGKFKNRVGGPQRTYYFFHKPDVKPNQ